MCAAVATESPTANGSDPEAPKVRKELYFQLPVKKS